MPVDTQKLQYREYLPTWEKCRDLAEGQEAVYRKEQLYLPKLSGQSPAEYRAYMHRALFYNATQRTIDAMSGMLFRKLPQISIPKELEDYIRNIDLQGTSLDNFVEKVASEVLTVGRVGLLVDHTRSDEMPEGQQRTQAEADAENLRPFVVRYAAEDIINWGCTTKNDLSSLSLVVLRETSEVIAEDYETVVETRYRVLKLDENGYYVQQIHVESGSDAGSFILLEEIAPTINGSRISEIPFVFLSKGGLGPDIKRPPVLDIVNINLSHYKTTADVEHAAHYTALPTPVVKGHTLEDGERLRIGSAEAWVFNEADADAYYLEYSGQGLEALERRLEKKENQMAALGARMLVNEKKAAESAETHKIKRQGEDSALLEVANTISNGVTIALATLAEWLNVASADISYQLNTDYTPQAMDPQTLIALLQTWQTGGIAFSDFVRQLQKGEIIAPSRTPESIQEELELEGPTLNSGDQEGG